MQDDDDASLRAYDGELSALFDALPRESAVDPREADRLMARLRQEGFLAERAARFSRVSRVSRRAGMIAAAVAILLVAAGAWGGWAAGRRGSLEDMLARTDLTVAQRVLLLQRAGSAYVTAANGYATATAHIDSTAVEVASRVLMGAAHAVARSHMDAGVASRLTSVLESSPASARPTIWY